jgi:aminoglycoside phosphotransferase (APT) family kinase protein
MSTVGHPLADVVNLLTPYTTANIPFAETTGRSSPHFKQENRLVGLPPQEQLVAWYREIAGWDPSPDIGWGEAFSVYKNTIIMQGIAARYAMRVASSAKAKEVGALMKPYAEVGWIMIERLLEKMEEEKQKSKI